MRGATIFWYLFSSGGVVLSLLVAVAWFYIRPRSRAPRIFLLGVTVVYMLASVYPFPHLAERWIAAPFHPLTQDDVPPGRSIVVLLGSGSTARQDWSGTRMSVLDPIGMERTLEAARVYRLIHPEFVISSGGLIDPTRSEDDPAGDTMRDALIRLGVPAEHILVERKSTNTREEALEVAAMLPTLDVQHVVLVTSAIHMRRSVGMFRAAGVEVIPAIAQEREYSDPDLNFLPTETGLRLSALTVHELAGLTYYWLKGWYK